MKDTLFIAIIGMGIGVIGTGIGGLIGAFIKNTTNRMISIMLEFSAGIMIAIVCFDLLPQGFFLSGISYTLFGLIAGVGALIIFDEMIRRIQKKKNKLKERNKSFFKTGILVFIGIMLHNFPEGLAIGSGFEISLKLGVSLAAAIALHDIPEGIAIALPLKQSGTSSLKILMLTLISGIPTGIGAFLGVILGGVSNTVIAICLGFAGGAMLYVVCGELIPESKSIYKGRISSIANIAGIILGIAVASV